MTLNMIRVSLSGYKQPLSRFVTLIKYRTINCQGRKRLIGGGVRDRE